MKGKLHLEIDLAMLNEANIARTLLSAADQVLGMTRDHLLSGAEIPIGVGMHVAGHFKIMLAPKAAKP